MVRLFKFFFLILTFAGSLQAQDSPPLEKKDPSTSHIVENWGQEETKGLGRFFQEFFHMLLALGLLIAFLFFISWLLKRMLQNRMQQQNISSRIKIAERRSLSPKSTVYLLEIEEKSILVGESHSGLTFLGELPPEKKGKPSFEEIYEKKA